MQWCVEYHVILDRVITALNCIRKLPGNRIYNNYQHHRLNVNQI